MGFEVSPQGIMTALIVAAFGMMGYVNRDWFKGLIPKPAEKPKVIDYGSGPIELENIDYSPMHVLDVMKILSTLNDENDLKLGHQISEIYAILTQKANVFERELDVLDLLKALTNATQGKGIDCHDELKEIYAKIVDHEPEEKQLRR